MKKRSFRRILSLILVLSMVIPSSFITALAEDAVVYEYEEVSVMNPVSNSWHVTTGTSGDGGPDWAFDDNSATHWHNNYTADVTDESGNVINMYADNVTGMWGTVNPVPAFEEIATSRVWIGGEFASAIQLAKLTYEGRKNAQKNWPGQYALYVANIAEGEELTDAAFQLAYTGTNSGHSEFTMQLDTPVTATHFRIVAFTATVTNNVSASEINVYEAVQADTTPGFGGSIVDIDTQYTQDRFSEVKRMSTTSESLSAWKNDKALSEIALVAKNAAYENVTVTASDLTDGNGNVISKDYVTTTFIKSTKAYNGSYLGYGDPNRELPADNGTNRSESSDILYQTTPIDMEANTVQPVWVEFEIPEDAAAGTYTGTIQVTADGAEALEFTYSVKVYNAVLPDATEFVDTFDIMQWQYPYSSAEYYDATPFSEEHMEILESIMGIYKEVGGNAITTTFTEEAWSGQTYSENAIHYPSMVKWTKNADGSFSYDYSDFDTWVSFCKEMGLGDKIVAYGIAPWHFSFTYWEEGATSYTKEAYTVGNDRYIEVWGDFLTDFAAHLETMGWKENVYIGIDERSVNSTAFDVAEAAGLKTAADIDNITNHWEIAQRVTDLNVGDTAAQNYSEKFAELLEIRDAKGYETTLYSCTEHQPGQFSLSAPVESYWAVLNAGMMGADGFNRWAYDAWVADPLNDTTHNAFEPGDCFVIFPDEKDAENPEAKYSVRLARMAQGVRDVNKLMVIAEEVPALNGQIEEAYDNIQYDLTTTRSYMSDSQVQTLRNETAAFQEKLDEITEQYVAYKAGVADEKKVSYYSFDNVTDTTLVDEWGDRDGVIAGSTAEGKSGNALSVTEAGAGATIDGSLNTLDTDWSVSYWVKTTADFTNEISVLEDSAKAYSFSLKMASDRDAGFRVGDNSGDVLTYAYNFEKDTWYHLTWVQDKDQGLSMYVNGTLVELNTWTSRNTIKAPIDVIGGTGFTGLIDEVKIFNAVLTQEEIASLMKINGINVASDSVAINVGDTYRIYASVISENADKTITYTSNNEDVATVSADGVITAKGVGRAVITLTAPGGYEAEINVKVSREVSILNELTIYDLPEEYQSNVEGAAHDEEGTLVGTDRQYLGQPDMVQTDTGRLITVFPTGHGHGPLIMKYSDDKGETWTEMDTPDSWDESQETPTIYSLRMEDGSERLVLICACPGTWGNYTTGWDFSYSDDNGETWTEFEHFWSTFSDGTTNDVIVGMASLVQLKDADGNYIQKWMGVYHNGNFVNYKTYLTFDENGEPEWSEPVAYLSEYRTIESSHQICEVGMFRSPDGEKIVALARNQTHAGPATMFYSDDEGETWSEPVELPGSLAGERHKAMYDPISDRLVITFREIDYDRNNDGTFAGGSDWIAGDWVAWVGTYEDLMNLEQGDYMIRLDEDFAANYYSGDCGYTGMAVLEDGTFVLHSYGHWDRAYSQSYVDSATGGYNVRTDLCWIRQAKFKLADVENEYNLVDYTELEACIEDCTVSGDVEYTEETYAVYAAALIQAETMVQRKNVQQVEVDAMIGTLMTAYEALEEGTAEPGTVNKAVLSTAIALAELLTADDYTEESWSTFVAALDAAKAVRADEDATQEAVNEALADLNAAKAALEKIVVIPVDPADDSRDIPVDQYTTTAGSTQSGNSTGSATDNNTSSYWEVAWGIGATNPEKLWYQIELDEAAEVEALRYYPRFGSNYATDGTANGFITAYRVEVSMDGTTWDVAAEGTWELEDGWKIAEFDEVVTVKYVRLIATGTYADVSNNTEMSIAEIRVKAAKSEPPVEPPVELVNPFEDVYESDYYYNPVMWAVEKEITDGWTPTLYEPNMGCTRGQVVTFLWRAAGKPKAKNTENPFTDVAKNAYYYDAVLWAVEEEITDGWLPGEFAPDMVCTRGQIVTFIWRAAGEPKAKDAENPFEDVAENAYYYDAVLWAVEEGITDGWLPTEFAPDMNCTRGQIVTFLYRYYNPAE